MNQPQDPLNVSAPAESLPVTDADATVFGSEDETALDPALTTQLTEEVAHTTARNARLAELSRQYPNQYVAYRDEWDGTQLVEPSLLAVSVEYGEVNRAVQILSPEQAGRAHIDFLRRPGVARMTPFWMIRDENGNPQPSRRPTE